MRSSSRSRVVRRRPTREARRDTGPCRALAILLLAVPIASCEEKSPQNVHTASFTSGASEPSVALRDVTERTGIDFRNVSGTVEKDYIIGINGGGVALFDHDGDGLLDIFLVNGSRLAPPFGEGFDGERPGDRLYRNLGQWRFEDVTERVGLLESSWGGGVAVGDVDNDGDADLYVTNYGRNTLWRNEGNATFRDVTEEAGVGDRRWGSSCAFLDYDRDGWLDLFVVNYLEFDPSRVRRRGESSDCRLRGVAVACGPAGLPPSPNTLYRNRGDGTFADVSESSGIRSVDLERASYGLGIAVLDADGDDWLDIYVANDTRPNLLYLNRGDGTFEEFGIPGGVAFNDAGIAQAGMGVDAVFLGEREHEDLFVVNFADDSNTYYRNEGDGHFHELSAALGLRAPGYSYLGWGAFFVDLDLDADQDLFVANGHVAPQIDGTGVAVGYRQRNLVFVQESGRFVDVSAAARVASPRRVSRGAAYGDLDGDGDADIVINELDDRVTVLENRSPATASWLAVRPLGTRSNRMAIGAVVTLRFDGRVQRRRVRSGSSYLSQSELVARFGLGEAEQVESLTVKWPSGGQERFAVPRVNTTLEVVEGEGESRGEAGSEAEMESEKGAEGDSGEDTDTESDTESEEASERESEPDTG